MTLLFRNVRRVTINGLKKRDDEFSVFCIAAPDIALDGDRRHSTNGFSGPGSDGAGHLSRSGGPRALCGDDRPEVLGEWVRGLLLAVGSLQLVSCRRGWDGWD